ncbi:NtaA/DmoA family FMN-dependent monooxygenase OS=Streptomyces microflavus OX=1919 GN=G3I39_03235 PE=3 SV=1 [Streptomyces microflavus]
MHLAAQLPGMRDVTDTIEDPRSESQISIDSFIRLAQTIERGEFDSFFLAEGLRLREHKGQVYDLDIAGTPRRT